jgi:hypothetical protein
MDSGTMYSVIVLSLLVGIIIFFSAFLSKLTKGTICCCHKNKIADSNQVISNVNIIQNA